MKLALDIALHVLLLGSLVVFTGLLLLFTLRVDHATERLLRGLALFSGAMIVVGAQAGGATYPEFVVRSLTDARPGASVLFAVIPAGAGIAVGAYFIHVLKRRNEDIAMRTMALVGMLAIASFMSIYAIGLREGSESLRSAAVPNLSFVVALSLYMVFNFKREEARRPSTGRRVSEALIDRLRRPRAEGGSAPTGSSSVLGAFRDVQGGQPEAKSDA